MVIGSNIFGIMAIGAWKLFNKYVNIKAFGEVVTKFRKDKSIIIVAPISFFVGILEFIGEMAKVASLSFRLFGNVFAGEVLLASMGAIFLYILPAPFLFLEVFIGLIQALIFSLLAAVYFTIASQDHGEHKEEHGHGSELAHV
jgi:F0F1-type ATP synthase membrane subunit a